MATIYGTDGSIKEVQPKNGTDFSLEELQGVVDGYVELIGLSDDRLMVVNEEGKLIGLPINGNATVLARLEGYDDIIVGDVLVCDSAMIK